MAPGMMDCRGCGVGIPRNTKSGRCKTCRRHYAAQCSSLEEICRCFTPVELRLACILFSGVHSCRQIVEMMQPQGAGRSVPVAAINDMLNDAEFCTLLAEFDKSVMLFSDCSRHKCKACNTHVIKAPCVQCTLRGVTQINHVPRWQVNKIKKRMARVLAP